MNNAEPNGPDTSDIPEVTDWSSAQRGRFSTAGKTVLKPIFLEPDVLAFLTEQAARTQRSESALANELLRRDKALLETLRPV